MITRNPRKLTAYAIVAGITLIAGILLIRMPAFANGVSGSVLTTSPISVDLSAKPGSSVSTTLQVQNNSPQTEKINVLLEKFKAEGETGQATIYKPSASDNSLKWIHFSQTSITAEPNVWKQVTVTIDVPSSAKLGYYYAVLFEPQTPAASANDKTVVRGANAIFLLLNTSPQSKNETRKLVVSSFTSQKSIYEYLPATFNVTVQNTGNIYLAPQGDVFISRSKNGKPLATLPINAGQGNILPATARQFFTSWADGFPVFQTKKINGQVVSNSKGQPEMHLQWNTASSFSKIRFGKYYAYLALVYNNGTTDVTSNATISFWVIPWKLILIIIAVIVAIIFVWKAIKKSTKVAITKIKK
jgi:hypothetical protein